MPIPCFSLYRGALTILVTGLCEDTYLLYLSISRSPKDPCGWPMRRYPSPCFFLYLETLTILVAGLCEDTHTPASLYIGKH